MRIDDYAPDWLERLDRLCEEAPAGQSTVVLVDGVFVPGLVREFQHFLGTESVHLLFTGRPGFNDAVHDVSPFVFEYVTGNRSLHALLERCGGQPMVSVIETGEPLPDLVARLRAWCVVENAEQRFNFRFPDTRRLPGILRTLTREQVGSLAGPAKAWHYMGRDGQWQTVALPGIAHPAAEGAQVLSDAQYAALLDDAEADALIVRLAYHGVTMPERHSVAYAAVSNGIKAAAAHGLADDQQLAWCEAYLRAGAPDGELAIARVMADWRNSAANLV